MVVGVMLAAGTEVLVASNVVEVVVDVVVVVTAASGEPGRG
jgi:hypothetical protein